MNIRRKNRLWIACAVLAGLALTIGLVLYALRSNIDLFYTPGEILYGKRETQQMPEVGQRLRVGGIDGLGCAAARIAREKLERVCTNGVCRAAHGGKAAG